MRPFPGPNGKKAPLFSGICRTILRLLMTLLPVLVWTGTVSADQPETVTLQLKWYHQFQFAGYYAAVEKGFYRDAGLEVILREGSPDLHLTQELLSGRVNYLVNGPGALREWEPENPILALAAIFQHSPLILITRIGSGINSPDDLTGKRVMYEPDTDPEFMGMCRNEGIDFDAVIHVPHTWNPQDLISGKADAMSAYLTNEPFFFASRGIPVARLNPLNYGIDFYGDCLFTTRREVEAHPERVKAFLSASLKGWEYAMAHPDEIIDLIIEKYNPKKSRAALAFEAAAMQELILPKLVPVGHMNPGRWGHITDTYQQLDMLPSDVPLKDFLYDPDPPPDYTWFKWFMGVLVMLAILGIFWTAFLLTFNHRLRRAVRERTRALSSVNRELETEISERKQTEQRLRESEERYRRFFETNPVGVVISDKNGSIRDSNPAFLEIVGYGLEDLRGKPYAEITPEKWHPIETERAAELLEQGYAELEKEYIRKDGEIIPVRLTAWTLKDSAGSHSSICAFVHDLSAQRKNETEKEALETQLRHAQKMEAIGTLAGGVAHDFNNLLMGIQGNVSLVRYTSPSEQEYLEHLDAIEEHVERAADLTRQLLGFARGGKHEVTAINLNDLIERQIRLFSRTRKEITIHSDYAPDLRPVEADAGQIDQIILNLFVNAWQAMPEGGEIHVETENTVLDEADVEPFEGLPGFYVCFRVRDTGTGMDEQTRQRIFEPFFTTKEMGRGTGLGLATVYGIVRHHGGCIEVDSTPGEGATFLVYLPASDRPVSPSGAVSGEIPTGSGTILLVDDESLVLNVGTAMIERLGYTVLQAENGIRAIDMYRENRKGIDLVILDLIMPGINGGEVFRRLREINPAVRVLISSGYSMNGEAERLLQNGCDGFIQKPFSMGAISRKIREILDP